MDKEMKVLSSIKDIVVLNIQDIQIGNVDEHGDVCGANLRHINDIKGMNYHCNLHVDFDVEDTVHHLVLHSLVQEG